MIGGVYGCRQSPSYHMHSTVRDNRIKSWFLFDFDATLQVGPVKPKKRFEFIFLIGC